MLSTSISRREFRSSSSRAVKSDKLIDDYSGLSSGTDGEIIGQLMLVFLMFFEDFASALGHGAAEFPPSFATSMP